jgi:antitoxin (DNA-binding transcriptional repressor) of toxin-antitoxin stability system
MVTERLSEAELAENLPDVLERVRGGERFTIERDGEPMAIISPVRDQPGITARELIARVGNLPFPGDGFADELQAVQAAQGHYDLGKLRR